MLTMQRYPWEQGVCAQALYEAGMDELWIPMAYDAVRRQAEDGRLAAIGGETAVSDPAANGEVCLRAYERTGDLYFLRGAERMLEVLNGHQDETPGAILTKMHKAVDTFVGGAEQFEAMIDNAARVCVSVVQEFVNSLNV